MNRAEILQRLAKGEITVDEATHLLQGESGGSDTPPTQPPPAEDVPRTHESSTPHRENESKSQPSDGDKATKWRWLKIRVGKGEREVVKINIPLGWFGAGMRFGTRFMDDKERDAWQNWFEAVNRGEITTLLEVEDDNDGDRVRIYVE